MTLSILVLTSLRDRDPFQLKAGSLPSAHTFHFAYLDEPLKLEIYGRTARILQAGLALDFALSELVGALFLPASFDKIFSDWGQSAPDNELLRRLHWNTLTSLIVLVSTLRCLNNPQSAIAAANKLSLHALLPDCTLPSVFGLDPQRISASLNRPYLFKSANDTSEIDDQTRLAPNVFDEIPDSADEQPVGIWQSFIAGGTELRCYFFNGDVISFEVPQGDTVEPDARYMQQGDYYVKEVLDADAADLVQRVCAKCGLNFAALDLLKMHGETYLVLDVNPHGSWNWLPAAAAERVRLRFKAMISDFFEAMPRK